MTENQRLKIKKNRDDWTRVCAWYIVGSFIFLLFSCLAGAIGFAAAVIAYAAGFIMVGIWSEIQMIRFLMEIERLDNE